MIKKTILLISSFIFIFFILEIFLIFFGRYSNLTQTNLKSSLAKYERASSSIQIYKHPDINYKITTSFDIDGVKNYTKIPTSKKKNIIGFFGDSFTENIAITKEFEYTNILSKLNKEYNFVNYGVGGYASDQAFLRYLKYNNHDLKHVFYLFMPFDQIFVTDLVISSDYNILIKEPQMNFIFKIVGKLNITYLMIDSYYFFKSKFKKSFTKTNLDNYDLILANKIVEKFYSNNLEKCDRKFFISETSMNEFKINQCVNDFIRLLIAFKKNVEKKNGKFHILVYPELNNIKFFDKIMQLTNEKFDFYVLDQQLILYSKFKNKNISFNNDAHWNEYGNLLFTKNLLEIFEKLDINFDFFDLNQGFSEIDKFYLKHQ